MNDGRYATNLFMTQDVFEPTDETLQYMHQTPLFDLEQQKKFEYLRHVASEITTISNHFTSYADIGLRMCAEFENLRKSFDSMEFICTDASIKPLCEIFAAVDGAFSQHFHIVNDKIVQPLKDFVTKHIESLPDLEKKNQKELLMWNAEEEKYVTLKPQIREEKKQEKERELETQHRIATLAFFDFTTRMEMIELKLRSLLPQMFMSYLTSVSMPFTDCLAAMTDKGEELNTTQNTINEVNQQIAEFQRKGAEGKIRLSGDVSLFWKNANSPSVSTSATSIQGYLWKKRTGSLTKGWHKRFFMISNGVLSWARTVDEALRSQKNVELVLCSVKPEPTMPRNNCFSISNNRMQMVLQALTRWDMERWLAVIQNSIAMNLNASQQHTDGLPQAAVSTICADCGASNASWASINWGFTLCEACCGEHRSLGATYSKPRSLQLDTIDPMQKALVEAIGTERANMILEAKVGAEKISPSASNPCRRKFIQMKYQGRMFVDEDEEVDVIKAIREQDLMGVYKYIAHGEMNNLPQGFTSLHAAACSGNLLIMHLLCLNATTLDIPDENGWTPLCYAVYHELPQMLDVLTSYGATLRVERVNPYDIAKSKGNEHMMTKLAAVMDTSTYSEETSYVPLHDEITPKPFDLGEYVANPKLYKHGASDMVITPGKKKKIDAAVSGLRHRLSTQNHGSARPLISDSDDSVDVHSDGK